MVPPHKCCNPFQKKNHNCVRNRLHFLSEKCDKRFSGLHGSFVCASCKRRLYKMKDSTRFQDVHKQRQDVENFNLQRDEDEEELELSDVSKEDKKDKNYECKYVDDMNKRSKLAAAVHEAIIVNPAKKFKLNISDADSEILKKSGNSNNSSILRDKGCDDWINDFKIALSNASTRKEKIVLFTTLPVKWSTRKIAREFGVSRRLVVSAKNLKEDKGYCSHPDKRIRRGMSSDLIEKVKDFYLSDNVSRVMPGVKDFKSIKVDGKRQHETVSRTKYFY